MELDSKPLVPHRTSCRNMRSSSSSVVGCDLPTDNLRDESQRASWRVDLRWDIHRSLASKTTLLRSAPLGFHSLLYSVRPCRDRKLVRLPPTAIPQWKIREWLILGKNAQQSGRRGGLTPGSHTTTHTSADAPLPIATAL